MQNIHIVNNCSKLNKSRTIAPKSPIMIGNYKDFKIHSTLTDPSTNNKKNIDSHNKSPIIPLIRCLEKKLKQ